MSDVLGEVGVELKVSNLGSLRGLPLKGSLHLIDDMILGSHGMSTS